MVCVFSNKQLCGDTDIREQSGSRKVHECTAQALSILPSTCQVPDELPGQAELSPMLE
jgi:hypothetical protein